MAGYVIKSEYLNKSLGKLFVDHDTTTVGKKFFSQVFRRTFIPQ